MADIEAPTKPSVNEPISEGTEKTKSKTIKILSCAVILLLVFCVAITALAVSGNLQGDGGDATSTIDSSQLEEAKEVEEEKPATEEKPTTPPFVPNVQETMPNVGFLLSGYDIMFGNPLPTSASGVLTSDPGFRLPIFAADFSRYETTQDLRYLVPDGLSVLSCTGTCSLSFTSTVIESSLQYRDQLGIKAKVSGSKRGLFKARFSASVDYRRVESGTSSNGETVTQSEASCCAYFGQLSSFDMPRFHPTFLAGLESLTDDYDERIYRTFLDSFGTHYIRKGFMGALYGEQSLISETAKTHFESQGIDIRAAASASAFGISVSAEVQVDSERALAQQFRRQGVTRSVYTHGAAPPVNGDPATWAAQTIESPAPIAIELERLDSLSLPISDAAKANLEKALDAYCESLVDEGVISSCDEPTAAIDVPTNPEDCPVQANPFLSLACADWSKVEPLMCGEKNCCYQNTCYSFLAGFNLDNCSGRGDPSTCQGFFS